MPKEDSPTRAPRVSPGAFALSRLPTLLLWNLSLALALAGFWLGPADLAGADFAYALGLGLLTQGVWLGFEYRKRLRLKRLLSNDDTDWAGLVGGTEDTDAVAAEVQDFKRRTEYRLRQDREAVSAYGDYLAGWIHELKTPLTSLRLSLSAARSDREEPSEDGKARYDAMLDEVDTMNLLLDQALFYARSQSFAVDYLAKPVRVQAEVRQLLARNARRCILRRLRPAFGPGFAGADACPKDWEVLSDPVWLGFILQQILSNALVYAPEGSTLRFDLGREESGGTILLTVEDEGPGVPQEELERIFERGFTGQARERQGVKATSTGMGLYLVKSLATRLGHRVWAEGRAPEPGLRICLRFECGA